MSTKRKRPLQLRRAKQRKKRNEDEVDTNYSKPNRISNDGQVFSEKCDEVDSSIMKAPVKTPLGNRGLGGNIVTTATIINCFRRQKQEAGRTVSCPVCERSVLYQKINVHLDRDCSDEFVVNSSSCLSNGASSESGKDEFGSSKDEQPQGNNCSERICCNEQSRKVLDALSKNRNVGSFNISHGETADRPGTVTKTTGDAGMSQFFKRTFKEENTFYSLGDGSEMNNCLNENVDFASSCTTSSCGQSLPINSQLHEEYNNSKNLRKTEPINGKMYCSFKDLNKTVSSSEKDIKIVHETSCHDLTSSLSNNLDNIKTKITRLDDILTSQRDQIQPQKSHENVSMNSQEPYYLQNFNLTINTVLSHEDDKRLFDGNDNAIVNIFQNLSDGAKKLYVRLFQRKFKWFQKAKIQYPRIDDDLEPFFKELLDCDFAHTQDKLTDLEEVLKLLPASDIQELAKSMHITSKNENRTKKQHVESLVKHSKRQCSLFANNGDRIAKAIVKKAKALLGPCVKLEAYPRNVFSRFILLFTLNLLADDDDNVGSQLSALFLINIGRVVYPTYEISRDTPIFQSRDELIRYEMAHQDLCRMEEAFENKKFDEARNVYGIVKGQFIKSLDDLDKGEPRMVILASLPIHLRRFSCAWLYTKMCSRGVELLQRSKEYKDAVDLLRRLLGQQEFCISRRGWWWERLALNLDQHLKKPSEALEVVRHGLADIRVRTGHRFALEQRAKKICEAKRNSSLRKHLTEISFTELKQPKVVTISGKRLSDEPVFVLHEVNTDGSVDGDVVSYCGVEEMALRHYRQQGYNEGIHGEGATFNSLFGLLMWDVIFAQGIPDVFRTPFQAAPLDIYCDNFYANRKELIHKRLDEIRRASAEELVEWIDKTWQEQLGKTCVGINWDLFSGVEQIKELARCIGSSVIAGICERFARDYRHTRSGLPDLVVWNSKSLQYKVVEVKGPNDRLSSKQHVWLDVLVSLGVDAEVLYVRAVGGRKL